MADPAPIECPEGEWTPVATNVITGVMEIVSSKPNRYQHTWVTTGQPAPTDLTTAYKWKASGTEEIGAPDSNPIDVYVYCTGGDGKILIGTVEAS